MDWKKVEEQIGHKILFAGVAGSRRWGINREDSDWDYGVYVLPKEGETYLEKQKICLPDFEETDFFVRVMDDKISRWAHTWTLGALHNAEYMDETFAAFFEENKQDLYNIYPLASLQSCRKSIQRRAQANRRLEIPLIEANVIRNFLIHEDFSKCFYLSPDYLDILVRIKLKKEKIPKVEMLKMLSWIDDEEVYSFFAGFEPNYELHKKLCQKLEEIKSTL